MERISDEKFIHSNFNKDKIIALQVDNGNFYFLGWMENAENYSMQIGKMFLSRDELMNKDLIDVIRENPNYDNLTIAGECGEDGQLADTSFENEYAEFLSYVSINRNDVSAKDSHDIFIVTQEEVRAMIYALCNGDYVFIVRDLYGSTLFFDAFDNEYEATSISGPDEPYLEYQYTSYAEKYNPNYGDNRICKCGHPYHRHFDSYENMRTSCCKYCGCDRFEEGE